ncbi:MAG TPA: hypothetical protein VFA21_09135 [Pyrinomonadaceae bacterium]|nr:hypothetical protein [Pyrinomonadaceae bacterium]
MSVKIHWALNVQVDGGPRVSASDAVEVDAYDYIEVSVPKHDNGKDGEATADVQPGASADVLFLLIQTDTYKDSPLSYTVENSTKSVKLDAQQTLVGAGATGLLDGPPTKLNFSNAGASDASVRILVGRKAV